MRNGNVNAQVKVCRCWCVQPYMAQDVPVEDVVSVDVPQPDGVIRGAGQEGSWGNLHLASSSPLCVDLQEPQREE